MSTNKVVLWQQSKDQQPNESGINPASSTNRPRVQGAFILYIFVLVPCEVGWGFSQWLTFSLNYIFDEITTIV